MKHIIYIWILCFPLFVQAQDCDCLSVYKWVKQIIEQNDAGYTYALEQKGVQTYATHNSEIEERITLVKDNVQCNELLSEWLSFFRSGHIEVAYTPQAPPAKPSKAALKAKFTNWETVDVDISAFQKQVANQTYDDFRGIWETGSGYQIGIVKEGEEYIGFVIKAKNPYWSEKQVKLRIKPSKSGWSARYYMQDHSERVFDEGVGMIGKDHMQIGDDFLLMNRLDASVDPSTEVGRYIKSIFASEPYYEKIDAQTAYIRIPSFAYQNKKAIDKLVAKNFEEITQTPNLIIDIRGNGGGSDASYNSIIPLLYTHPIRTPGIEFYASELNKQSMLGFATNERYDEDTRAHAQRIYDALDGKEGTFVNVFEEEASTLTLDTVYQYPSQVAILMHKGNYSSAEQFLLDAMQSQKVKLMGTSTGGAIDISNMTAATSPCGDFQLAYALSRSLRIPDMAIDGHGIQPDIFLDSSIPKYHWITFAQEFLK
ncbi:MAG: S41 family peptidase [Bacteroidota bacterium]